jgi:hypothetical protein
LSTPSEKNWLLVLGNEQKVSRGRRSKKGRIAVALAPIQALAYPFERRRKKKMARG